MIEDEKCRDETADLQEELNLYILHLLKDSFSFTCHTFLLNFQDCIQSLESKFPKSLRVRRLYGMLYEANGR